MKVLDPMSGVRLASGHPFYHVSLFVASWIALAADANDSPPREQVQLAFRLM